MVKRWPCACCSEPLCTDCELAHLRDAASNIRAALPTDLDTGNLAADVAALTERVRVVETARGRLAAYAEDIEDEWVPSPGHRIGCAREPYSGCGCLDYRGDLDDDDHTAADAYREAQDSGEQGGE